MDAITVQILRNKVASLVDEMHYHFYRSGYSTIIRESRDFSCVILDRTGRLIVAPPMFFHAPVYRHLVGRILETRHDIRDGDVFVSNHPYEGGLPHVSDMAFVAPVFADGEIVAFSGSIAHKADVGGAVAGSTSANDTEMFHEGLRLPPIKIVGGGVAQGGIAHFDFSNSDPQAKGPVNLRPSMVEACVFYSLIGCLGPDLHFNDGMRDAVRLTFAPRTVVNADPPAPVSNYQMVNLKLVDVILEALGRFHPARAIANAGSSSALTVAWAKGRSGQSTMQYEIMGSAYGGGTGHDGASATATHLSNLHITPIEILETEFPCRISRFELVPNTGGAGQWRGGLSLLREYELLDNATVIRRYDKSRFPPTGLAGGKAGCGARFVIRLGTAQEAP